MTGGSSDQAVSESDLPFAHSMAAATTRTSIAAMTMMRKSTWDLFFMGGSLLHKTKNCVMTAS